MDSLTIGYVSGMIAAAIAVTQFIVPNALALVLVATLSDRHTAVTWSVVARSLSNTDWPLLLGSDQTASQRVSRQVNLIVWLRPTVLLSIAIAAIVTPMGLYETMTASESLTPTSFSYIQDSGPLGLGTLPRSGLGFSRRCGDSNVCPDSSGSVNVTTDDRWINVTTESMHYRLPESLAKLYQSGLTSRNPTVSSFFDIEARLYNIDFNLDQGNATFLRDSFRRLGTFILDDKVSLVDGLVVDAQDLRIGFRNHTAPVHALYGAEWAEELLFLEPETVCVNLNLTLELENDGRYWSEAATLVDDGGFANMDIANPWTTKMGGHLWYGGTQEDAQLGWRARSTAWTANVLMAYLMNITKPQDREAYMNSAVGNRISINTTSVATRLNEVTVTTSYDSLIDIPYAQEHDNGTVEVWNTTTNTWANPYNISHANFTRLPQLCQGFGVDFEKIANITNILVQCGLVFGLSQPVNGEKSLVPRPHTKWRRPIFSCASTTKASIKNVHFRYNAATQNVEPLNRLEVIGIKNQVFDRLDQMPLWGVENAHMNIIRIDPLWGIIDPTQATHVNLSTTRADHLYLPAGQRVIWSSGTADGSDYIPAATGPGDAWNRVYNAWLESDGGGYTGASSIGLYKKWDELTQTPEGTAEMLNRIWIDHAANAMVGTRGHLSTNLLPPNLQPDSTRRLKREEPSKPGIVPVHLYHRAIRYKWVYGIPAIITAFLVMLIYLGALVALIMGRVSLQCIKHYLWALSAGRILTSFIYPESSDFHSRTKQWIQDVGAREIIIAKNDPHYSGSDNADDGKASVEFSASSTDYQQVAQDEHNLKQAAASETTELVPMTAGRHYEQTASFDEPQNTDIASLATTTESIELQNDNEHDEQWWQSPHLWRQIDSDVGSMDAMTEREGEDTRSEQRLRSR